VGGADGIALDVGRELLTHDFLLRVRPGKRWQGDRLVIPIRVRGGDLAHQAAQDPNSPIASLLAKSSGLAVLVELDRGELACTRIATTLTLPEPNEQSQSVFGSLTQLLPHTLPLVIDERSSTTSACRWGA
jgi:hypothetical protein